MEELVTYNQINGVESIVQQLVDNIYNDEYYQEYLKDLEEDDSAASTKKATTIKKTFMDIKVFNNNTEPLFLANEIGIILGASNITASIKNFTPSEKVNGYILDKTLKKVFLTKHGVYRLMFTNKSKLSEVFRGFIYKLIDHMFTHEINTLRSIINTYVNENPNLVKESLLELEDNIQKYKILYNEEKSIRIDLETELSFNDMYIEQLKMEKKNMLSKLDGRNYDESLIEEALETMKKKFLKEFTISLVNPTVLDKMTFNENDFMLNNYKKGYRIITEIFNQTNYISVNEILYLSINYGVTKDDSEFTKIASDYTYDKNKFAKLIETLKEECDHYQISKGKKSSQNFVFKTNIEHINLITKNLLIE
jgi:BRO family, N-terminal domain